MAIPLTEFIEACAKGDTIILGNAETTAREQFNLFSKPAIRQFIGDGNLENIEFRESREFKKNPAFTVHSYNFYSGKKYGYLAFFLGENQKWFLKSFKLNLDKDSRGRSLFQPLGSIAKIGELKK